MKLLTAPKLVPRKRRKKGRFFDWLRGEHEPPGDDPAPAPSETEAEAPAAAEADAEAEPEAKASEASSLPPIDVPAEAPAADAPAEEAAASEAKAVDEEELDPTQLAKLGADAYCDWLIRTNRELAAAGKLSLPEGLIQSLVHPCTVRLLSKQISVEQAKDAPEIIAGGAGVFTYWQKRRLVQSATVDAKPEAAAQEQSEGKANGSAANDTATKPAPPAAAAPYAGPM